MVGAHAIHAARHAVRRDGDRGESLPPIAGETFSGATDVSSDGSVILGATNRGGAVGAFAWTASTGKRDVLEVLAEAGPAESVAGWTVSGIAGLSDDGRIVAGAVGKAARCRRIFRAAARAPIATNLSAARGSHSRGRAACPLDVWR